MVINELREKVQALAAELLRIKSGGAGGGDGTGEDDNSGLSATTVRELAVASTPARQTQRPLIRASSSRTGAMDVPAPLQRELTILRARAAEAEGEVLRLTEEAKRARKRENEKSDALAELKAELDLAHADMAQQGGTGTDQLMADIAEVAGKREERGEADESAAEADSGESGSGEDRSSGGREGTSRERALAVVKDFHQQIQGLEEKLHDSERQRAGLERQLVQHSGSSGVDGAEGGGEEPLMVGLSAKLAAAAVGDAADLGTNAVDEAKKRCVYCRK